MVVSQSPLHRGSVNKRTLSVEVRKAPAMPAPEGEACPGVGLSEEQQSGGLHLLGRDAETQCRSQASNTALPDSELVFFPLWGGE